MPPERHSVPVNGVVRMKIGLVTRVRFLLKPLATLVYVSNLAVPATMMRPPAKIPHRAILQRE